MARASIRVPKEDYQRLARQAKAYRAFAARFFESVIRDPVEDVMEEFRMTGLYTDAFLHDLESGLRKSSYAKRHGTPATARRS